MYDEPFADSSQIPTSLVSKFARRDVTVALTGDGGDELFGGYPRYVQSRQIWDTTGRLPLPVRRAASRALTAAGPAAWDRAFAVPNRVLPVRFRQPAAGNRAHNLAEILACEHPVTMYRARVSLWQNPTALVLGATEPKSALTDRARWADLGSFTELMMYLDLVSYLPDDILVKVDRASMGVSLEARAPFLDHRVVEFAWRLPLAMKLQGGRGKRVLRQVLDKYVPAALIERPKAGFGVPIGAWLRGPLRPWAEDLLAERRLRREGFLAPAPVRARWVEHLSGQRDWAHHLWAVLMFQAWLEAQPGAVNGGVASGSPG